MIFQFIDHSNKRFMYRFFHYGLIGTLLLISDMSWTAIPDTTSRTCLNDPLHITFAFMTDNFTAESISRGTTVCTIHHTNTCSSHHNNMIDLFCLFLIYIRFMVILIKVFRQLAIVPSSFKWKGFSCICFLSNQMSSI